MSVIVEESDGGTKKRLEKALKKMKKALNEGDEIKRELAKIWERIRQDAYNICAAEAWDTGSLASTIRVTKIPTGVLSGSFSKIKEIMIFDRSIVAGDMTVINPKSGKPVDYAVWVHDGHRMKDGRMFSGVQFLTRALAMHEDELMKAIDKALKKLGKDYERE